MQGDSGFRMWCDARKNASSKDGMATCRKCGCTVVLLPNDKRHGFCYDCYDPMENEERIRIPSIMQSRSPRK